MYMAGRPKIMTQQTLGKLREAFLWGCTDQEACLNADINPDTLYEYQKKNPTFTEQKEQYKSNPVLLARKIVVSTLKDDAQLALKYLERKKKDEFSLKQSLDITSYKEPIPIMGNTYVVQNASDITEELFDIRGKPVTIRTAYEGEDLNF